MRFSFSWRHTGLFAAAALIGVSSGALAQNCAELERAAAARPAGAPTGVLGLRIQPLYPDQVEALQLSDPTGELVQNVTRDSAAAKAGIRPGDIIKAIDQCPIAGWRALSMVLRATRPGQAVAVLVSQSMAQFAPTLGLN